MGKADTVTKVYMSGNDLFADAFNFLLYDGQQVIRPEQLRELDKELTALPHDTNARSFTTVDRHRDLVKQMTGKTDGNAIYLILGIENQTNVHYAMPVRNMLYDALSYVKQVEECARSNQQKDNNGVDFDDVKQETAKVPTGRHHSRHSAEYLSGFGRNDKLIPVITLVIFWSPDKWDGPLSLHEMLDMESGNRQLLSFMADYRINLISPEEIADPDFRKFRTSLAVALQYIKHKRDSGELRRIMNENPAFRHADRRTVELLNAVTKSNIPVEDGEEEIDMCEAIEEMKEDARTEGLKAGMEVGKADLASAIRDFRAGVSYETLLKKYGKETADLALELK